MATHLVVVAHFGDYKRGDKITDPDEVKLVLEGENQHAVIKVEAPAE